MWNPFKKKTQIQTVNVIEEMLKDAGVSVNETNVKRLSAVFTCGRVIAESIMMLPLSLYQKKGDGREKLDNDLAYLLSVEPNEWMTAPEFWEMAGLKLAIEGNFYAYINRVGNKVEELLPITGRVTKKQSENYEVWYEVNVSGKVLHFPESEILHIPLLSFDGLKGVNPITHARTLFEVAVNADNLAKNMINNPARPGGVLSSDLNLTKEQMKDYRKAWDEQYSGSNSYRTAIIGNGFKYYPTSFNAADLQFMEQRKMTRSEIAGLFRVPPHMIGDLENATFTNIEHQGQDFVTHCLMPYLRKIEARIRKSLVSPNMRKTTYAKFNVGALVRGDMAARSQFYTQLVQNGALSPNEIRELEDRPPREGGDIYLTPMNMLINGQDGRLVEITQEEAK